MALAHPSVPDALFLPSAFSGEAVPFVVTAFREGHDRIGVHVRLFSLGRGVSAPAVSAR
jgi:starch synthase (maltosyl-transferring)